MNRLKVFKTNDPAEIERKWVELQEQAGTMPSWPPVIVPAVNLSGGFVWVAFSYYDNTPAPAPKQPEPVAEAPKPMPAEEMVEEAPAEESRPPKRWGKA